MLLNAALSFHLARRAQENNDIIIPPMGGLGRDSFGWMTPVQGYAVSVLFALGGFGMIIRWIQLTRRNRDE